MLVLALDPGDATRQLKLHPQNIHKNIRGKNKTCGGYIYMEKRGIKILALDPGECTGVCIVDWPHNRQIKPREDMSQYIKYQGHIEGKELHIQAKKLEDLRKEYGTFDYVIFEKFLLYGHKAATQIGSEMHTSQVIAVIKMWAMNHHMPKIEQMAQNAKKFYTDQKLKDHKVYPTGLRHSKDATRHALYAIDFNICKGGR